MKKLIDELEKHLNSLTIPNDRFGKGWKTGYVQALRIVRAHNPWREVTKLPPADESEPDFSIDVLLTDGERCRVGYYAFRTASWIMHRYFKNPVTGWTYLPEVKP